MKKLLILLYSMLLFNFQCGEQPNSEECSDADKCGIPVSMALINLYLSSPDSVMHVGDTLRFYARIPDTLTISEGPEKNQQLLVKSMYAKSENAVGLQVISGDSIAADMNIFYKNTLRPRVLSIQTKNQGIISLNQPLKWNPNTRDFECFLVLDFPGYYTLNANIYQLTLTTTDNRNWLLRGMFRFADQKTGMIIEPRYNQYLKHIQADYRAQHRQQLRLQAGWYYWEVKP